MPARRITSISIACRICDARFHPFEGREQTSLVCSLACNGVWQKRQRVKDPAEEFWKRVDKRGQNDCWEWRGAYQADGGYGLLFLSRQKHYAHRFSYQLHKGSPGGLFVCHTCDNPKCVNPAHLFLGTLQDNHADMMRKGRHASGRTIGEASPNAKLDAEKVRLIRADTRIQKEIAKSYGVSKGLIAHIKSGRAWKHI